MFARWPDVDMRAANVAVLEQRERVEYRGGGNAVESGTIPAITQDTGIDASMAVSILRTVDSVSFINVTFKCISPWEGCREGNGRGTSARKLCGALLSAWTSVERQFTPTRPLKFSAMTTKTWSILLDAKSTSKPVKDTGRAPGVPAFLCARL
jgi:hypothetical protein